MKKTMISLALVMTILIAATTAYGAVVYYESNMVTDDFTVSGALEGEDCVLVNCPDEFRVNVTNRANRPSRGMLETTFTGGNGTIDVKYRGEKISFVNSTAYTFKCETYGVGQTGHKMNLTGSGDVIVCWEIIPCSEVVS